MQYVSLDKVKRISEIIADQIENVETNSPPWAGRDGYCMALRSSKKLVDRLIKKDGSEIEH